MKAGIVLDAEDGEEEEKWCVRQHGLRWGARESEASPRNSGGYLEL